MSPRVFLAVLLSSGFCICGCPRDAPVHVSGERANPATVSFSVYSLSRGKGVPPAARDALRQIRQLAEADLRRGVKVAISEARIGIEGETRLCVTYSDPDAGTEAFRRATAVVRGVELVNLEAESCAAEPRIEEEQR